MFLSPFNFALQRTPKEAVGFFIIHFAILSMGAIFLGSILGVTFSAISGSDERDASIVIGGLWSFCYCTCLCIMLIRQKRLAAGPMRLVWLLVVALLSLPCGFLALMLISYLSTRPNHSKQEN